MSCSKNEYAPLAQLDRAFGYEPKGQGFESLMARHERNLICLPNQVSFNDIRSSPVGVPAKPREARFVGEWAQNG